MTSVYRAPMRSRSDQVDVGATHDRAFALGVVGFGAAPDARVDRFAAVADGSFVWTCDVDGLYRLGRVSGPYRYDGSADARRVDLVHVRPCTWLASPLVEAVVPAAVLATYRRGGRNFQQTHSATVGLATDRLWTARA